MPSPPDPLLSPTTHIIVLGTDPPRAIAARPTVGRRSNLRRAEGVFAGCEEGIAQAGQGMARLLLGKELGRNNGRADLEAGLAPRVAQDGLHPLDLGRRLHRE